MASADLNRRSDETGQRCKSAYTPRGGGMIGWGKRLTLACRKGCRRCVDLVAERVFGSIKSHTLNFGWFSVGSLHVKLSHAIEGRCGSVNIIILGTDYGVGCYAFLVFEWGNVSTVGVGQF